MAKVTNSIVIHAPVEKVFGYMADPSNLPEIWPSLQEVTDVRLLPEGVGSSYRWVYKMGGMRFRGRSEMVEYVPNQVIAWKDSGESRLEATRRATFEPADGGLKLIADVEYTIPVPLLGRLAEAVIVRLNENEGDVFHTNLKARMEA